MQKIFVLLICLLLPVSYSSTKGMESSVEPSPECYQLYIDMKLQGLVDYSAFEQALAGYNKIEGKKKQLITLIDFTKPSTEERLFVLDMKYCKLLYKSHVAHGRNSGENYATSFSNVSGSHKSSLGFYLTESTYNGRNGYSLILNGLEKGINDKAKERAIVMHGADYANPSIVSPGGRLGRSFGCPALPRTINKTVIDTIKDGSVIFIYAGSEDYLAQSTVLAKTSLTASL